MFAQPSARGFLTGFASGTFTGTIDATGIITAPAGVVANVTGNLAGNVTGNLTGNVTGLVDGIDIDSRAPLASPTFTGTTTVATLAASVTVNTAALSVSGAITKSIATPAQITTNLTDTAVFGNGPRAVFTTDASRNLYSRTGLALMEQTITNGGAQDLVVIHDDGATGTATLRYSLAGGTNVTIGPGESVKQFYDTSISRFRLEQFS